MLKKKILSIIILLIICITTMSSCYAAVPVTEENLLSTLQDLSSYGNTESEYQITVQGNKINIENKNSTYTMDYDLTGKPKFTVTVPIQNGISYDEYNDKMSAITLPMVGYIAVAKMQGVSYENATMYITFNLLSKLFSQGTLSSAVIESGDTITTVSGKEIKKSEFPNKVMEFVNDQNIPSELSDTNGTFDWNLSKRDIDANSCEFVSTLIVNTDADFTNLQSEGSINLLGENTTNDTASTSKETSNITSLPKAGIETDNTVSALYCIFGMAVAGIIVLIATSKKK